MNHETLRLQFARGDVQRARRNGSHLVGRTTAGTVELEKTLLGYRLIGPGTAFEPGKVLAYGTAAEVARALAPLYVIEEG